MSNMEDKPLISVIVPVYKVEKFLPRCVDSLIQQTYSNLEVILVDDGSPDRCGEICEEYARVDSRIRVIHKINGGLSSARNAGLDIARGDYIAFVDSDDWVDADCYEKLYMLAVKYQVGFVYAGRYDVDGTADRESIGLCPEREELISGEEMATRIFHWDHVDSAAWDKLYARSLFDGIRYPENVIVEDLPVTYRLALCAGQCVLGNFPFYHYYHRPGSITTTAFSEKAFFFPETALRIVSIIENEHPEILNAAKHLRVRALGWTVQMIDISPLDVRKKYAEHTRKYRSILRSQISFFLRYPRFTITQKRDYFLISLNLYRFFRFIFHFFKKSVNS